MRSSQVRDPWARRVVGVGTVCAVACVAAAAAVAPSPAAAAGERATFAPPPLLGGGRTRVDLVGRVPA